MKKTEIHRRDWFIALLVAVAFAAAYFSRNPLFERLELAAYDIGVAATHRLPGASEHIVIVAIDDASIAEIGRWPWPRSAFADVLERLAKAEARAVALLLDLSEPQPDRGLGVIRDIREHIEQMQVPRQAQPSLREVRRLLQQAERTLDADSVLAEALRRTPRPHLPLYATPGAAAADALPAYLQRQRLRRVTPASGDTLARPPAIERARSPLALFAAHAAVGHTGFDRDPDGGRRALYTALAHGDDYYPALPLLLAASHSGLDIRHLELEIGRGMKLGRLHVPADATARSYPGFQRAGADGGSPFPMYAFRDVAAGAVAASAFTNKIVLVGPTADGVAPRYPAPGATAGLSEVELTANAVAAVLNQDFYTRPAWAKWAEAGALAMAALYLLLVLPHLRGGTGTLVSLLLLFALLGAGQFLMVTQKLWLRGVAPALLILAGHLAIGTKRLVLGERLQREAEADAAQTNRMLGLTFQSQGQLDMAMDKFRSLPVNESVLELIYNLALDFERKRQFHKAAAAYDYILAHDPRFRDCAERKKRASQGDQAIALGKTLILDGAERPTLGRYLIEKEIGRGAMGVVYLGLDPKINRRVAIKTLALSEEFDEKELPGVRERFFREAETAGRLHHPNIVTIYDAGEDHDLAYIAMEYLEGKSLDSYIDPAKPPAFGWILDIAIQVADALAYAHRQDVVHRDIKPNNIIYHESSGSVKVMDFGIARLTASSRTKTGLVLGTPAYMSPEQITGKRVDGRSDLYSFGAMLFELVTGDTPFDGDSFAALMHQITNATAPEVRKLRPDTPRSLAAIIKKLLQKQVTKRYQTGEELKRDLEACRNELDEWAQA